MAASTLFMSLSLFSMYSAVAAAASTQASQLARRHLLPADVETPKMPCEAFQNFDRNNEEVILCLNVIMAK